MKFFLKVLLTALLVLPALSACLPAHSTPLPAGSASDPSPATAQEKTEESMNIQWAYQTAGALWGSPTLNAGSVLIGSDDGNLYMLDSHNGHLKWKFQTQGVVRSQPAVAKGQAFFSSDDGFLYAVSLKNGKQVWRTDIGNYLDRATREALGTSPSPTGYDYLQSSPLVVDGSIYVGSRDGNLYALSQATGAIRWTFATGDKIRTTPAFDQGVVYIGSWDKLLYAIDAQTGKARWATPLGGQIQSTALVANGLVYCASRKASVVALDAQTGELKWEHNYGSNIWVESSPRLVGDVIYIGSSGSKFVLGLNALTGQPTAIFPSPDFHWSSPLVIRDTLYIGGESFTPDKSGGLYSLKIVAGSFSTLDEDRQVLYLPATLLPAEDWYGVASSPVTADDLIYFGGLDGKLYAVNALP